MLLKSIALVCCTAITLFAWTGSQAVAQNHYSGQQQQSYDNGNYADNSATGNNYQPSYANQGYSNPQPQPQPRPQPQPQYQQSNQYDERTNHALNNGEYIGDGDYHGEGLQESGAFDTQNSNSQNNYVNNDNYNSNYNSNNDRSGSQGSKAAPPDYGYSFEIAVGK